MKLAPPLAVMSPESPIRFTAMGLNSLTYPIHERFATFQGEGVHMGKAAFFIRTFGCPVQCPWCDSAGTWHPHWVPKDVQRMSPTELAKEARGSGMGMVVITGGEPTVYDLEPLTDALDEALLDVHLETSGSFPIKGNFDWVTLSPKRWKLPLQSTVAEADEFKLIIEAPEDIGFYLELLQDLGYNWREDSIHPVWLHPEWSQRDNRVVLDAISTAVRLGEGVLRAGWQLHKLYQVDARDARSRPLVPLGGVEEKGY